MSMSAKRKIKPIVFICILIVLILTFGGGLVYPEKLIITNIYKGLFRKNVHHNILPTKINSYLNCCRIDNPAIKRHNNGNWSVKLGEEWYRTSDYVAHFITEEINVKDTNTTYVLNPKYNIRYFGHDFEFQETEILFGDPNAVDYLTFNTGIYMHKELLPLYSFCDGERVSEIEMPIYDRAYLWASCLRDRLECLFSKSYFELQELYSTNEYICYNFPMIYIPYPISDKGYIFSSDIIADFIDLTEYVDDQNFYATYVSIPSDIKRLGTIVKYDDNGVLLKLPINKTSKLRVCLQKLDDKANRYAAIVHYKESSNYDLINEEDYQNILHYSNSSDRLADIYDDQIFANLRRMLSNIQPQD